MIFYIYFVQQQLRHLLQNLSTYFYWFQSCFKSILARREEWIRGSGLIVGVILIKNKNIYFLDSKYT